MNGKPIQYWVKQNSENKIKKKKEPVDTYPFYSNDIEVSQTEDKHLICIETFGAHHCILLKGIGSYTF